MNDALLTKLRGDKQWAEIELFTRVPREDRPSLIKEVCMAAVSAGDEEGALRMLLLLALAIEDVEGPKSCAASVRASVDLWRLAPVCEERPRRGDGEQGLSRREHLGSPVFLKYKHMLIEDVVRCWKSTESEEEAAFLLDALVEMINRDDPGVADILSKLLKETPGPHAHRERIVGGVLRISAESAHVRGKDLSQALWISLARTFDRRDLLILASLLQLLPLNNLSGSGFNGMGSTPLFEALERDLKSYRAMHDAMEGLRMEFERTGISIHNFLPKYQSHPPAVELSVWASRKPSPAGESAQSFFAVAEELARLARAWRGSKVQDAGSAPNSCPVVKLIVLRSGSSHDMFGTKQEFVIS